MFKNCFSECSEVQSDQIYDLSISSFQVTAPQKANPASFPGKNLS